MSVKILGAIMLICGCGSVGLSMAAAYRREEHTLRQLSIAIDLMCNELHQRSTPLPELCQIAAQGCSGGIAQFFMDLSTGLREQIGPDAPLCMLFVMKRSPKLPERVKTILEQLRPFMGRFDLEGQLKGLGAAKRRCQDELEYLGRDKDQRLRSYKTLGLCAGIALAILFL